MTNSKFNPADFDKLVVTETSATQRIPEGAVTFDSVVESMIVDILGGLDPGSFQETVESIYEYGEINGFLTKGQYAVINRAYAKHLEDEDGMYDEASIEDIY